ncbi:NAD(P)H-dependent glycerol-3-phosphate dehydrogenase [Deinococcus sp. Marseille-Q6407]|uniref:NAD(P)H-dependent glycerol-3-phosphate dehydrogenase n=1 Tax=Deinococcus sp. Marseille-Q6407 TaxID=2969223 RepID=UPI0021BE2768|nr:NAD(P)H-dependent glycerol-3-phosphate dehydrogenase [Deinococcus sp. Marseille-Q6407]
MTPRVPAPKVAVLGAGGWGTALALSLLRAGHSDVTLWARRAEAAQELRERRENVAYLPGVPLPPELHITSKLAEAVDGAELALVVTPSVGVPDLLAALPQKLPLLLCAKGLGPNGERLSELARAGGFAWLAVLSGPNHAEEIGRGLPAATVIASDDPALARRAQALLQSASLRPYTSGDPVGVELGGVLKNVLAVAAGLVDGLHLGDNAKASLLTRGLPEMARYLDWAGAQPGTLYGLSGLGDLIATAGSRHSRNRAAGEALALGEQPEQGGKVVEGLRTARLLHDWGEQHGFDLPIIHAVSRVAAGEWAPQQAARELMEREMRAE